MNKRHAIVIGATLASFFLASSVVNASLLSANAVLTSYVQDGTITNTGLGTITAITYDLGIASDGIATWDTHTAGGIASNFLSDSRWFQTVTWNGLSINSGETFTFTFLDIDLIETISPLSVSGSTLDTVGTSLANATLNITWDNGYSGSVALTQQDWSAPQNLWITDNPDNPDNPDNQVPEPSTLLLLGLGLLGLIGTGIKRANMLG